MGADHDVDAVDLVQGEPVDRPQPSCRGHHFRTRGAETLSREGDPPGSGERELFRFSHLLPFQRIFRDRGATAAAETTSTARDLLLEQRPDFRRRRPGHNQYAAQSAHGGETLA